MLISSGRSVEGNYSIFPYIMKFVRDKENLGNIYDFKTINEEYYAKITEEITFGSKPEALISDLKTNTNGIEVYFKPLPGKETDFFAAYTNIPPTKAYHIKEKGQIVFEFDKTNLDEKFIKSNKILCTENSYFNFLEFKQEGENSKIIINLKEVTKEYTVRIKHLPDNLPYAEIVFR